MCISHICRHGRPQCTHEHSLRTYQPHGRSEKQQHPHCHTYRSSAGDKTCYHCSWCSRQTSAPAAGNTPPDFWRLWPAIDSLPEWPLSDLTSTPRRTSPPRTSPRPGNHRSKHAQTISAKLSGHDRSRTPRKTAEHTGPKMWTSVAEAPSSQQRLRRRRRWSWERGRFPWQCGERVSGAAGQGRAGCTPRRGGWQAPEGPHSCTGQRSPAPPQGVAHTHLPGMFGKQFVKTDRDHKWSVCSLTSWHAPGHSRCSGSLTIVICIHVCSHAQCMYHTQMYNI